MIVILYIAHHLMFSETQRSGKCLYLSGDVGEQGFITELDPLERPSYDHWT